MNISINKYEHRKTKFVLASENKVQISAHGLCLLPIEEDIDGFCVLVEETMLC